MKDIKQKGPVCKTVKAIDKGTIASERMKDAFIRTKDQSEESYSSKSASPTEYAADSVSHYTDRAKDEIIHRSSQVGHWGFDETKHNIQNGAEKIRQMKADKAVKSAKTTTNTVNSTANNSSAIIREQGKSLAQKNIKNASAKSIKTLPKVDKTIKQATKGTAKTATKSVKTVQKTTHATIKTSQATAKTAQATAKASVKTAKTAAQTAKVTAKAVATTAKAVAKATVTAVKAIIAGVKGLVAAIAAGGWVAVIIILVICMVGLVAGSGFGIFFSNDPFDDTAIPVTRAVSDLNTAFYDRIEVLEQQYQPDVVNIGGSDGVGSIRWDEVLSIFSVKTTTSKTDSMYISQIDESKKDIMRTVMNDMNIMTHSVETQEKEIMVEDEDGNEVTITVTETILNINIEHKPYTEIMNTYSFNRNQKEQVELLLSDENRILWAQLLGGFISGSGQIIISGADIIPIGRFNYPLPDTHTITSYFGYRTDPFTGETKYHNAIDIAAPERTPILAADSGTVIVANATDSWGGGYGYYVTIEHTDGYKTLYAHCFGISVVSGQQVQKGEVIGYVGTTGRSTGNHLHFEVIKDGDIIDPLSFFRQ